MKNIKNKDITFNKYDFFLIFVIIIVITSLFISNFLNLNNDDIISVYQDGKLIYQGNINEDKVINLDCATVIIENETAYMINSTCPDKICEKMIINKYLNEIICIPNKIVIKKETKSDVDAIT